MQILCREPNDAKAGIVITDLLTSNDISNDEMDFGLGLELGLNFFCFSDKSKMLQYHGMRILKMAYTLLGWNKFAEIATEMFPDDD